jgi:hypothetical protein
MARTLAAFGGHPMELTKNVAPISVSPDKLARSPTFVIPKRISSESEYLTAAASFFPFSQGPFYFGLHISLRELVANSAANHLARNSRLIDETTVQPTSEYYVPTPRVCVFHVVLTKTAIRPLHSFF